MRPTALGGAFEEQMQGEVTTFRHTLSAAGSPYAMVETNPSGTVLKTQYLHADHQGSIKAVSDTSGAVIERMGYDAWGKRSDALSHSTTRGYTAHEMLDNVGLIHMNGRVYDPLLARFLSVDPINQAPDNAQSYNPYSYVFNSPMMFTDPSGFSAWAKYRRPVVGITASILTYGAATQLFLAGEFTATVVAGAAGGGIQSGTMEGALRGAVMAAAFYGVGEASGAHDVARANAAAGKEVATMTAMQRTGQVLGHAAVACGGAVAAGGQCGPAALAQGFTSGVSPYLPSGYVSGTIAHAGVGAMAAKLVGGDAREGAFTAAYAYLFNELNQSASREAFLKDAEKAFENFPCVNLGGVSVCLGPCSVQGVGVAAKVAGQLGREGEAAVRAGYDIGEKGRFVINGRARISDGLNESARTLSEVKNVGRLSFTRQLRDYLEYAQTNDLRFDLYTRQHSRLSGPLQNAVDSGLINRVNIP